MDGMLTGMVRRREVRRVRARFRWRRFTYAGDVNGR